jgi:hypothetical protein
MARWFRPAGWLFIPVSVPGAAVVVGAVAFCVQVFVAVDRRSHSVSDTLYGVFPYFALMFLLVDWVASRSGGRPHSRDP